MVNIIAVRHVDFEHLGTLEPLLTARSHTVRYVDAGTGPINAAMADEPGLIGHACEIAAMEGVSVEEIRNDTVAYGADLTDCAARMFADWLNDSGL